MTPARTTPAPVPPAAVDAWRRLTDALVNVRFTVPCTDDQHDMWTSDDHEERAAAAFRCQPCPIKAQCLAYADAAREKYGVWAGTDRTVRPATRRTA